MTEIYLADESYKIMGACFEVYNQLGVGFLEDVYHECLEIEMADRGIPFRSKMSLKRHYRDRVLKKRYVPDLICFDQVIVEIKAVSNLNDQHKAQLRNYLTAAKKRLGILVNFNHYPKIEYQRILI